MTYRMEKLTFAQSETGFGFLCEPSWEQRAQASYHEAPFKRSVLTKPFMKEAFDLRGLRRPIYIEMNVQYKKKKLLSSSEVVAGNKYN